MLLLSMLLLSMLLLSMLLLIELQCAAQGKGSCNAAEADGAGFPGGARCVCVIGFTSARWQSRNPIATGRPRGQYGEGCVVQMNARRR
jgi:hypothetical protein